MENIQFHEEESARKHASSADTATGLIGFLMRRHLARTARDAEIILMVTITISVLGMLFIFMFGGRAPEPMPIPAQVLESMQRK